MIDGKLVDLREFVDETALAYGKRDAYRYIVDGNVVNSTFNDLRNNALSIASWFAGQGWTGKHIVIIGSSCYGWIATFLGIMCSSNVAIPIDKMLPEDEILWLLRAGDADVVFLSEEFEYLSEKIEAEDNGVIDIISMSSARFREILGTEHIELPKIDPEALAEILFTSGTTGVSKGVMLNQRNIVANINDIYRMDFARNIRGPRIVMSVLPIHHTFELTVDNLGVLYCGATVCINDKLENIVANLNRFKPAVILVVPTIAEIFYKKVMEGLSNDKARRRVATAKKMVGVFKSLNIDARRSLYKSLLRKFGGNLANVIVGGAALRPEIAEAFDEFGVNMYQGYGLTECAPLISANYPGVNRFGSVGKPVSYMDVKIENGEILVKGAGVMLGYYKNPEATAEAIDADGWLHTGDLGYFDSDGYLYITGRSKNLIILDNGKNIYPEELEGHIAAVDGVKDVMVYENKGKLCAAIHPTDFKDAELAQRIKQGIKEINAKQPTYKKIVSIIFISKDFPRTTTQKIKRRDAIRMVKEVVAKKTVEHVPPYTREQENIVTAFENVLGCKNIGIKDDFFEMGGDSLSAFEVASLIGVQPQDVYENPTAEKLETALLSAQNDATADDKKINVNELIRENANLEHKRDVEYVLLTGATGYLGAHILRALLKRGIHVTCLVRSEEKLKNILRYYFPKEYQNFKYRVRIGDIKQPKLGLSDEEYDYLVRKVDMVIHTAANVNHTGSYSEFERTNVIGTQNVIDFCMQSGAVMEHTSTASVHGAGTVGQRETDPKFDEFVLDVGQNYTQNVYIHSKYKAEERVLLARKEGLNANIFRIGNLTWRMSDGKFQRNSQTNGFLGRCRGLMKLKLYCSELDRYPIDFTPVDECAEAYVRLALDGRVNNIYNMYNPHTFTIESLGRKCFVNLKKVSREVLEQEIKHGISDKDIAVLSFYSSMAAMSRNVPMNNDYTVGELKKVGFKWSRIGVRYLGYMKKIP